MPLPGKDGFLPAWMNSHPRKSRYESIRDPPKSSDIELSKMTSVASKRKDVTHDHEIEYSNMQYEGKDLPTPPSRLHSIRHGYWTVYHRKISHLQGYHFVILCCATTGVIVILINLVFTIWAIATFGIDHGIGTLQKGDCERTKTLNFWIHLAINVLSTLLLSASNYTMQCLSSPTRQEIDKAHAQRTWLDIGVPSFRNLRRVSKNRTVLWCLLALSSIPLHLLYNSTVFSTLSTQQYNAFLVSSDFEAGYPLEVANTSIFSMSESEAHSNMKAPEVSILLRDYQHNLTSLIRMENEACIKAYTSPIISGNSNVLVVSDYSNQSNSYLVSNLDIESSVLPWASLANQWLCAMPIYFQTVVCDPENPQNDPHPDPHNWTIDLYTVKNSNTDPDVYQFENTGNPFPMNTTTIQYCLSRPAESQCKTQFSLGIMITILICNLIKVISMGTVVWQRDPAPLVTLGDAIASFLDEPDFTTEGVSLYGKSRFKSSKIWDAPDVYSKQLRSRWFRTVSKRRWIVCNALCITTLLVAFSLFGDGLSNYRLKSRSISYLWSLGFGSVSGETVIGSMNFPGASGLVAAVLIANMPQLILSFLYFTYNSLFTCMLLTEEWCSHALKRKGLRVTSPRGVQRGTYRLQLPYQYGIPLLIGSGLLHWLVSQSIFLVRINVLGSSGIELSRESISTCGYSPMASLLTSLFGCIVIAIGIGTGFRTYKASVPLAGSCSAVISAACHPPLGSIDTTLKRVKWEMIKDIDPNDEDGGTRQYSFI